jgi:hypothetical protein
MEILLLIYALLGIATFIHVYDLGYKTGLIRTFNYISDPKVKEDALKKRKFLTWASSIFGGACIFSLLLSLYLYGEEKYLFINIIAIVATPFLIFVIPYGISRKHPYKWEETIGSPPVGVTFD